MDSNKNLGPNGLAEWVFSSYFRPLMEAEDFGRAFNIFKAIGWQNERSAAIQFFAAVSHGKLPAVLTAYERFLASDSFIYDKGVIERAAEIKLFADYIYGTVIAGGDHAVFFAQIEAVEIPKIFDTMEMPYHEGTYN